VCVKRRDQSEIIEHRWPEFARKIMHDSHRFFHKPAYASDVPPDAFRINCRIAVKDRQMEIDAQEELADFIM
jgi:hypothetical protein